MRVAPSCPRCGRALNVPRQSGDWRCEIHGAVLPLQLLPTADRAAVDLVRRTADVPLWVTVPLPARWTLAGLGWAGGTGTGVRATALAMRGPAPLGGEAEVVVVAEEPGVGLGSAYAGSPDGAAASLDLSGPAAAKVHVGRRPTALWAVPAPPDRCVVAGEAMGMWLWVVLWPAAAGYLLAAEMALHDLRESVPPDVLLGVVAAAPSLRLLKLGADPEPRVG